MTVPTHSYRVLVSVAGGLYLGGGRRSAGALVDLTDAQAQFPLLDHVIEPVDGTATETTPVVTAVTATTAALSGLHPSTLYTLTSASGVTTTFTTSDPPSTVAGGLDFSNPFNSQFLPGGLP